MNPEKWIEKALDQIDEEEQLISMVTDQAIKDFCQDEISFLKEGVEIIKTLLEKVNEPKTSH